MKLYLLIFGFGLILFSVSIYIYMIDVYDKLDIPYRSCYRGRILNEGKHFIYKYDDYHVFGPQGYIEKEVDYVRNNEIYQLKYIVKYDIADKDFNSYCKKYYDTVELSEVLTKENEIGHYMINGGSISGALKIIRSGVDNINTKESFIAAWRKSLPLVLE